MLDPRDVRHATGHHPTVVEEQQHRLVPLGAVGAHHRLAGPGGGRPVDASQLIVDAVLAQLVELGAAAATLRRAQPDLEDPGPVDAQLGLGPAGEHRVHPQDGGYPQRALAGAESERAVDSHDHVADLEPAAAARRQGGAADQASAGRQRPPQAARRRSQRRCQLVGQAHPQAPVRGVAQRPAHLTRRPQHEHRRQLALDLQLAGVDRDQRVRQRHREQQAVHDHQRREQPGAREGQHDQGGEGSDRRQAAGRDGSHDEASGAQRGTGTVARMPSSTPSA